MNTRQPAIAPLRHTALSVVAQPFLDTLHSNPDTTELVINGPDNAWLEISGVWTPCHHIANLDLVAPFNSALASYNKADHDKTNPLLSASLHTGERVQTIIAPTVQDFALAIRRPSTLDYSLSDYEDQGALELPVDRTDDETDDVLNRQFLDAVKGLSARPLIETLVQQRKTMVICGGTSSGKTTFFNAIIKLIPPEERLISIEDVPEITLHQPNSLKLLTNRNNPATNFITLLEACLRLRPDRILAAEIRNGSEAMAFLEGANTGHPGSITTLHANSTLQAKDRLTMMLMRQNIGLQRDQILDYINETIDVFLQMKRTPRGRVITEIDLNGKRIIACEKQNSRFH